MWSEIWGTLVWGSGAAVPAMGPVGWAFLVGVLLGVALVVSRRLPLRTRVLGVASLVVLVPLVSLGVPNTFVNGTVADADEVNANFQSVEALEDRFAIVQGMADVRTMSSTYVDVAGRTITYDKQSATSLLKVTWQDSFGLLKSESGNTACLWRLLMDGSPVGGEMHSYSDGSSGWRIWPGSMQWLLPGVAAGSHTFQLQTEMGSGATQCLHGWVNGAQQNFLMVEERGL